MLMGIIPENKSEQNLFTAEVAEVAEKITAQGRIR